MRRSAPSIACRILASVCFSFSWMWTSLLPLAWSAISPWRPELFSIVHCNGLAAVPPSSSPRLRSSASRKISTSISCSRSLALDSSRRRTAYFITVSLRPQRGQRLVAQHVHAGEHADRRDKSRGGEDAANRQPGRRGPRQFEGVGGNSPAQSNRAQRSDRAGN